MTFTEPVYFNSDKIIRLKDYSTDKLVENIDGTTLNGMGTNVITFKNKVLLKNGVRYYIDMDQSSFLDYSDNSFSGILDKEIWNFMVNTTDVVSLDDQAASITIYPNPASGLVVIENLPDQIVKTKLEIRDVTGRKLEEYWLAAHQTQFEYNSSGLKSGIYMIQISTPEGKLVRKLMKN